jgi:hypothetical protein
MKARYQAGIWTCGMIMFAMAAAPLSAMAQNLLEKATIAVSAGKAGEAESWVPEITFEKQGKHPLRVRAEFSVEALPAATLFTLKKPPHINAWTLNGKPLVGPPKDMFIPEVSVSVSKL